MDRPIQDEGRFSSAVVRIKTQVIGELRAVAKLREQYRLGQLLSLFKQKLTTGGAGTGESFSARDIRKWAESYDMT